VEPQPAVRAVASLPSDPSRDQQEAPRALGLLVLGMHRSGTSAVAGLLAAAGFAAGAGDDLMGPSPDNPTGFFERKSVVAINDRVLERAGGTWDHPPARESLDAVREEFLPELHALVDRLVDGADGSPLVVKDPRVSLLLSMWLPVTRPALHPLLVVRNPLETARSLARRNAIPLPVGLALWELYSSALLAGLHGSHISAVRFEDLIDSPTCRDQLLADARHAIQPGLADKVVKEEQVSTIERALWQNRASDGEFLDVATVRQAELWAFLSALGTGAVTIRAPESLRTPGRAARAAVDDFARQRGRTADLASQLNRGSEELEALRAECALRGERVDELRTAVDLLAGKIEAQTAELQQRGAAYAELERAQGRLVAEHTEIEQARNHLDLALTSAQTTCAELRSELVDLKGSETWRLGSAIVRPIARLTRRRGESA
jgi:hypothetical protein